MQNVSQTVISQYAESPVLNALINSMNAAIDPAANITAFYNNQWNVATAQGYGLDCWGRIVGVSRVIAIGSGVYFGLSGGPSGETSGDSLNIAPLYSRGNSTTTNISLTDNAFRQLIYAKALANICNGSIPAINSVLMLLFGQPTTLTGSISGTTLTVTAASGQIPLKQALTGAGMNVGTTITAQVSGTPNGPGVYTVSSMQSIPIETLTASGIAYCTDGRNMTMTYTFNFVPTPVQLSIIQSGNVLPRPSGVAVSVVHA